MIIKNKKGYISFGLEDCDVDNIGTVEPVYYIELDRLEQFYSDNGFNTLSDSSIGYYLAIC